MRNSVMDFVPSMVLENHNRKWVMRACISMAICSESNVHRVANVSENFTHHRICSSQIDSCVFLSGAPLTVAIVQIPLRFQVVNSMESL